MPRNPSIRPSGAPPRDGQADPEALLSEEQIRRRRRELWISATVFALLAALLLLQPIYGITQAVTESGLFLLLNALTVFCILLLSFLVARSFWKLIGERRRGILGSHLNLKIVLAFVVLSFVACTGLFVVSAFFITDSIDRWFSVQVDSALEQSGEVAESFYESTARAAVIDGEAIGGAIARLGLMGEERVSELSDFVHARQREHRLGVVEVYAADGEERAIAINPEVPAVNFSRRESDLVRAALAGEVIWRVEEVGSGDVIRAAVPVVGKDGVEGAVVVNAFVPISLARKVSSIRNTLDQYRVLNPESVRTAYLLEMLLGFTVVLMLAMWMGFRLAKGVTGPIRLLAEGTAEVARGNLDVVVERSTDDEVGVLVRSFNRMTRDLREARTRVERSAAELDRRRRTMEIVLGTIGAGVVSVDAEGRISTINPSAQLQLGAPAGAGLIGQPLDGVATCQDLLEVIADLSVRLRPGRDSARRQVEIRRGDDVATLLVSVAVLQDESGEAAGRVIVFDDHTQLVKVQRMAAWREVARRIAHEIKNPLTPIQLSAQRIRRRFGDRFDEDDGRVFDECVDTITRQVEGLELLVDEFSKFARLPAANPRPNDLNRLVQDAVASYAGTEGIVFETDLDPRLPSLDLDREQIHRALTNLIDNAIGAGGAGRIRVGTTFEAALQTVRIEIADDGAGIPIEHRRRIFEPYFSTRHKGTGLGLAIVSRIVADHHGYIRVRDHRPRGTCFVIEIPVHAGDPPRGSGSAARPAPLPPSTPGSV